MHYWIINSDYKRSFKNKESISNLKTKEDYVLWLKIANPGNFLWNKKKPKIGQILKFSIGFYNSKIKVQLKFTIIMKNLIYLNQLLKHLFIFKLS